jgi:hypothetical protein
MLSSFPLVPSVLTADAIIILTSVVGLDLVLGMTSTFAATSITLSFHALFKGNGYLISLDLFSEKVVELFLECDPEHSCRV